MNNVNDVITLLRNIRGVFVTLGKWELAIGRIDSAIALLEGMGGEAVGEAIVDKSHADDAGATLTVNWTDASRVNDGDLIYNHPPTQTAAVPPGWALVPEKMTIPDELRRNLAGYLNLQGIPDYFPNEVRVGACIDEDRGPIWGIHLGYEDFWETLVEFERPTPPTPVEKEPQSLTKALKTAMRRSAKGMPEALGFSESATPGDGE